MGADDWNTARCFGLMLDGRAQPSGIRKRGEDATLLLIYNAWHDLVEFKLPSVSDQHWKLMIDTNISEQEEEQETQVLPPNMSTA
jgi:isoamylase